MESNQVVLYSAVIILGLFAGIEGGNFYESLTETDNSSLETLKPEGTIISEDPEFSSYDETFSGSESIVTDNIVKQSGPWRILRWRYIPESYPNNINESAIILQSGPEDRDFANAFQFMRLPEEDNLRLVMEGRNGATALEVNETGCRKVPVFISVNRWKGQIPPENVTQENVVMETRENKTSVFGPRTDRLVMEIPDRFKGEKVVFFGGTDTRNIGCNDDGMLDTLHIKKLYIDHY